MNKTQYLKLLSLLIELYDSSEVRAVGEEGKQHLIKAYDSLVKGSLGSIKTIEEKEQHQVHKDQKINILDEKTKAKIKAEKEKQEEFITGLVDKAKSDIRQINNEMKDFHAAIRQKEIEDLLNKAKSSS